MKGKGVLMRAGKRIGALCLATVIAVMPMTAPRSFAAQGEDLVFGGNGTEPEASVAWQEQAYDGMPAEALSEELTQKLLSEADLVISTAEELRRFAEDVTKGNSYEGKTVRLAADIAFDGMTPNNIEPIGYVTGLKKGDGKAFEGTFDGMGHTVSGIVQTEKNRKYHKGEELGLFYMIGQKGVVKNLTVKDSLFRMKLKDYNDLQSDAGVIAAVNAGEIRNCHAEGCRVSCCGGDGRCWDHLGGISGRNCDGSTVNACSVTGTVIEGHYDMGGITGYSRGAVIRNCFSGAVLDADDISCMYNNSDEFMSHVGGIAGRIINSGIINCANTGAVSITTERWEEYDLRDDIGGIAGYSVLSHITGCYNSGAVTQSGSGGCYIGGLVGGANYGTIGYCAYSKSGAEKPWGFISNGAEPGMYRISAMSGREMKSRKFLEILNKRSSKTEKWTSWEFTDASPYPVCTGVYDIEVKSGHGTVSCGDGYACEGKRVTLAISPEDPYRVTNIHAVTASGKKVEVDRAGESGAAGFIMPGERVCVVVSYGSGSIADCSLSLSKTEFVYNGKEKTPSVSVKDGGTDLKEGTDYEVSYASNTNAGTGIVTVTGKGSYTGTAQLSFAIAKAKQKITVLSASTYTVTDGAKAFSIRAKASNGGKIVYSSSGQSAAEVSRKGRVTVKGPGLAVITVKAPETENYAECTREVTVTVEPKQVKLTKLTPQDGKKLKAEWKALQNVSGYLVEYSLKKNFKDAETVTVKGTDQTSALLKRLTAGKNYYVRVTAYKEVVQGGEVKQIKGKPSEVLRSGKIK